MRDNNKISVQQFKTLILLYTIGTTILVIPSSLAATAKQDAWIAAIAGVGLSLIFIWIFTLLWRMSPEMTFVGLSRNVLGEFWGGVNSVIFIFYSFIGCTTVLFYVGNFLTTEIMPETPIQFTNILFASVVIMGVRLGIEVLARAAQILLPWVVSLFLILTISVSPQIKWHNIQPVYEVGIKPIIWGAFSYAGTAALPFLSFFMIFPHVNNIQKSISGFYVSVLIGGAFVVTITLLSVLVLGYDVTSRSMFPSYTLAKTINIGHFFQRIEAIVAGMWFITIYFKTTFYLYGWLSSLSELMRLRDYRVLCFPLGIILVVFSLVVYPNVAYMQTWDGNIFVPYILTVGLLIPIFLLLFASIKKMVRNRK